MLICLGDLESLWMPETLKLESSLSNLLSWVDQTVLANAIDQIRVMRRRKSSIVLRMKLSVRLCSVEREGSVPWRRSMLADESQDSNSISWSSKAAYNLKNSLIG